MKKKGGIKNSILTAAAIAGAAAATFGALAALITNIGAFREAWCKNIGSFCGATGAYNPPIGTAPEWSVPAGFQISEFRSIDRAQPPPCYRDAAEPDTEPVPINRSGLANLALLKQAHASASSLLENGRYPQHQTEFLNDGWYNNCRSWIAGSMPSWVEIDLREVFEVSGVRFGSEHKGYWRDRAAKAFAIGLALDQTRNWKIVYEHGNDQAPVKGTMEFPFASHPARFIRVDISHVELIKQVNEVRIDELEIYGRRR